MEIANDPMNATNHLPGDDTVYPAGTYFAIGDRTHKVLDKNTPVTVKNGGVVLPTMNYAIHYQKGYVEFYAPITPTGGANDVQSLVATGATAGQFSFTFFGVTITIVWNESVATLQPKLDAAYGAGNFTASGTALPTGPLAITGSGVNQSTFIATGVIGSSTLVGGMAAVTHTTLGTSGITLAGAYVNTALAANVGRVASCRDWQFTLDEADVDGTDYDSGGFGDHLTGIGNGTFQFERMEVEMSLYQRFRQAKRTMFAFYTDVRAPRYWLLTARIRQFPESAPVGGIVGGQIQGTISGWPDFLQEPL
ncbi:MAG: hypothetical protein M3Y41_17635 [Pseudomonadota bacterium]|nr:hypothetical protein [Pseudomonadota bacterium]